MLDLQRLRILQEVAIRGSFSAAALSLNFSTSAISQQIAQLEREVGSQLLDRRSNGVVLTVAGELLLGHAKALLARAAEAESEMLAFRDGASGKLRCGAFSSAIATLMPDAISALRRSLSNVLITLVELDRRETLEGLRRNELDVGVVARNGVGPDTLASDEIERIGLFVEQLDVIMSTSHRLAGAPSVAMAELADEAWAECSARPARRYLDANRSSPRIVFEGDGAALLRVIAEGAAICLLPRLGQRQLPPGVVAKPVAPDPPTRRVEVAFRKGDERTSVRTFVSIIDDVARPYRDDATWSARESVAARS